MNTIPSRRHELLALALSVTIIALTPSIHAADPFGPLRVAYEDQLEPGVQNARVDLSLALPKGSDMYDVSITIDSTFPFSTEQNTSTIGRMGSGTSAISTFYISINETAEAGVYSLPAKISYRTAESGSKLSVTRDIGLYVEAKPLDPFGLLVVSTDPWVLAPGLKGAQVNLAIPYLGSAEKIYDVTVSVDLEDPFSSTSESFYVGMVTGDVPIAAVFYLDVGEGAVAGEYDVPVLVEYRLSQGGDFRSSSKVAKLFVVGEEVDPFGSLGVSTSPSVLVPGLEGVELRLGVPYVGGVVDRLYGVSVSLGLPRGFSSVDDTYDLGMLSRESPVGSATQALFYIDLAGSVQSGSHRITVTLEYSTSPGGPRLRVTRHVYLLIDVRGADALDPFGHLTFNVEPSTLVPGLEGVELRLTLPYIGFAERLYEVSLSLDLSEVPLSSVNEEFYLGMMTPQSPIAPVPLAVFYLDVGEGAVAGEYDVPVLVEYRLSQGGEFRSSSKVAKLFVVGEEVDPFGSLGVSTSPSVLVPGLEGVELRLELPYLGGLVDRLYDVSIAMDMPDTFQPGELSYHLGIVSPQSPVGPTPHAVFYLDVGEGAVAGEYDVPVLVEYRLSQGGDFRSSSKVAKLFVVGEEVDPFGSLGVSTSPSVLVPGLEGVELRLGVPYVGGVVDRLYGVSVSLGLPTGFSSVDDTYDLGMLSRQSPIGPTPQGVFYLDVDKGVAPGEYDVPVRIMYRITRSGEPRAVERSAKVLVNDPDPIWVVRTLSGTLGPGTSGYVSFLVENKGGSARDVTARFTSQGAALVKPEEGTQYLGDFESNESKKIGFPVLVEEVASGNQLVTLSIEYSEDGRRLSDQHSVTLRIGGTGGPSLLVENVEIIGDSKIGGQFEVAVKITNVGNEDAISTLVDLILPASLGIFGSGSTVSIGDIPAGTSSEVRVTLGSDTSATEGTKTVGYLLKWSSAEGQELGREGSFGVTLAGEPRIVIQRVDIDPPKLESKTKGTFQVTVRNTGTQIVSDIQVQVLGKPELFTETLLPIGSLFPKQTDSVVFGMYVDPEIDEGVYAVTVSLTYIDKDGEEHEETSVVDLRIFKEVSLLSWQNLLIILAIIGAAILIYLLFGEYLREIFASGNGGE